MEHVIEYKTDDGFWETYDAEAMNWNQALRQAPQKVKEADDWRVYIKTELIRKEQAVHSGVIDDIIPE